MYSTHNNIHAQLSLTEHSPPQSKTQLPAATHSWPLARGRPGRGLERQERLLGRGPAGGAGAEAAVDEGRHLGRALLGRPAGTEGRTA